MKNFKERRKMKQEKRGMLTGFLIALFCSIQLLFAVNVYGQQPVTVNGTVTDAQGQPLPGVTVVEEGTTNGTVTNNDGVYTINVPGNATLTISFVGTRTQQISVSSRTKIDLRMEEETIGLEEVVAIGYGEQRRRDITGAVSTVDVKEFENRAVTTLTQALQGMVSGLNIANTSGQPGTDASYMIRGLSTLSNNPVLIIIDGVPSSMNQINPNDIKSISVLKDAASTAIYGSRAAGGVILITTKEGKYGEPQFKYNGIVSIQSPTRFAEKVSALDHALLANEMRANDGQPPKYSDEEIQMIQSSDFKSWDWEDALFSNAIQTNQNFSISGGSKSHDYYVSFGYLKQDGIVLNSNYERFNIQLNHNFQVTKNLKLGFKAGYSPSNRLAPGVINFELVAQKSRLHGIRSEDGYWLQHPESTGTGRNPIAMAHSDNGHDILKSNRFLGNFSLDYEITPDLKLTGTYGVNRNQSRHSNYRAKINYYNQYEPDVIESDTDWNILSVDNSSSTYQDASLLVNFKKTINDHNLTLLAGLTSEWYEQDNEDIETRDFLTDNLYTINAGTSDRSLWDISGSGAEWALASVISRATYSFKNRYLLEGNIRYDGSSRFKEDVRWGLFPSVSMGWVMSEESFLKNNRVLTYLKLRGSWGQVGNQNVSGYYPFASAISTGGEYFNDHFHSTAYISNTANTILSWETKETVNLGIDGKIFDHLLEFNVELFKDKTKDILLKLPVPTTFGQSAPVQNAGIIENRGWELELRHRNTIGDFSYGISLRVSDATNKVIDLVGQSPQIVGSRILEEGYPMYEWYGLRSTGIFQTEDEVANSPFQNPITSPGDLKYEDNGGDSNTITSDDRIRLGRSDARFPYGIRVNLSYKNFDFVAFGQGVMYNLVQTEGMVWYNFTSDNSTLRTYHLDRWTPDNTDAYWPKLRNGQAHPINTQFSSFWLQDAAYFRMKHVELGYSIPKGLLGRINIDSARLFVSAENLFVITNYLGFDPELPNAASYPLPRLFNFGVTFSF